MKKLIKTLKVANHKVFAIYQTNKDEYDVGLRKEAGYWTKRDFDRNKAIKVPTLTHANLVFNKLINEYFGTTFDSPTLEQLEGGVLTVRGVELLDYITELNIKSWDEISITL